MIRILILLMALNTIFTPVSFASVCASDMSKNQSNTEESSSSPDALHTNSMGLSQTPHCDHCDDASNMDGSMKSMDCDSGCSVNCLGVSVALTSSTSADIIQSGFSKPISGYIGFYTRSISPELHPPLV